MSNTLHLLTELRSRVLKSLLVLGVVFVIAALFANHVYAWLAFPLLKQLAHGPGLIATKVPAPFLIPIKSALVLSVFITIPYLLSQLWQFVAPALYAHERRLAHALLLTSVVLFYLGVCFAYFFVLPLVFKFFIAVAPSGVEVKPDITEYFSFVMRLFFAFGFAFEVPIAIVILVASGVASVKTLRRHRPYIIVGAFVVGMLLTPPDIISQVMLAVPIWLLFELGLWMTGRFSR